MQSIVCLQRAVLGHAANASSFTRRVRASCAKAKPARFLAQRKRGVGVVRLTARHRARNIITHAADAGATAVEEENPEGERDLQDLNDIRYVLNKLYETRNMTFPEIKLILLIEDPRAKMRREAIGVEDESGVSRDDITECVQQINDGYVPTDRMSLRKLAEEMREWPYLELSEDMQAAAEEGSGTYASITDTGVQVKIGEEESDSPVPAWMGYGLLYTISTIPVIIGVTAVIILFINSLR